MISKQDYSDHQYSVPNHLITSINDDDGLIFPNLPKEIILYIVSYLVGDFNHDHVATVNVLLAGDLLKDYIPPFENITTLIRFACTTKRFKNMIMDSSGEESFERFWLKGFVLHQKIMYWIRTKVFDVLDLCKGDLNATEMDEALRLQVLIGAFERGKPSPKLNFDTIGSVVDERLNMDDYCNEDICREMFKSRMARFNVSFEDYEKYYKDKENAFEMFLTQSIILSLEMYNKMDSECLDEWRDGKSFLLSEDQIESWPHKSSFLSEVTSSIIGKPRKSLGIRIESSKGWEHFVYNSKIASTASTDSGAKKQYLSNNSTLFSNSNLLYSGGLAISLLSYYWSYYFLFASPLLMLLSGTKEITSESNQEGDKKKDDNHPPTIFTRSPIDLNDLKSRLSGAILLDLVDVLYLDPLENFEFPSSIKYLSIAYCNTSTYSDHPQHKWASFFNGCTFPGVRYLRIYCDQEEEYYGINRTTMEPQKTYRIILESLLSSKVLPNLKYLVLSGFSQNEYLFHQIDYLKQLYNIDILFNYESRDANGWLNMTEFTSRLSHLSKTLKYVVVETDIDPRGGSDHKTLKEYYDSHNTVASLGTFSISRFYYTCYE